jgi:nicotinate-nucleotide adenylyltransferase
MRTRIGLYGGSFDPVHLGHLLVAQAAHEEVGLDKVIFVPAAQSPFKPDRALSPDKFRVQLLRLALAARSYCEIDCQELQRGGVSYTIETISNYRARFPEAELFYLIGADHVGQLPKWREARKLGELIEFVVIPRPGQPEQEFPAGFRGRRLSGFPLGVSSSQIRERLRIGLPVDLLTGAPVAEAIAYNRLYLS